MPVVHVVSFKYKDSVSSTERTALYDEFGTFATQCLYTDGQPYMLEFKSSTENTSPENAGKGFHHIFVSTFPSQAHVRYYLEQDPSQIGADGQVQEELCKVKDVQTEVAAVKGYMEFFDGLLSMPPLLSFLPLYVWRA